MAKSDAREFQRQVTPHLPILMAMARRLTRGGGDAEDLVQDSLVKAFRARSTYREGTNLKAWLVAILRNTFLNNYRRQNLHRKVVEGPEENLHWGFTGGSPGPAAVDPETGLLRQSLQGALVSALDELPEEYASVVVLADVEELSYREISEAMGCPMGTVMSRLHRARRMLRTRLGAQAQAAGLRPEVEPASGAKNDATPAVLADYRHKKAGSP